MSDNTGEPVSQYAAARRKRAAWLQMHGLTVNPFLPAREAESGFPDWQELTIDVGGFYSAVSNREGSCVIFGARGRGKTALCRVLEADCWPRQPAGSRLGIPFYRESFARLEQACRRRLVAMDGVDFLAAALLQLCDEDGDTAAGPSGAGSTWSNLACKMREGLRAACTGVLARPQAQAAHAAGLCRPLLSELALLTQQAGCRSAVLLVDEVSESAATGATASLSPKLLLAPLFNALENCRHPQLKIVAFLPAEWEEPLAQEAWFALDKIYSSRLSWNAADIGEMLDRRLEFYSRATQRIASIEALCDRDLRFDVRRELAALADGRPRCALALAEDLIEQHCARDPDEMYIARKSWMRVAGEWSEKLPVYTQAEERVRHMYVPVQAVQPVQLRLDAQTTRVYLGAKAVDIGEQDYRVLAYLYSQQGELCTANAIVVAAWPDAKQGAGVSDQALAQSISRLRRAFEQVSPAVEYIENKKGRGYILWPDGSPA